jgi:CRP-like cAMP-binding protein
MRSKSLTAALDKLAIQVSVPKESVLFQPGDIASAVYVVRKGKIALTWADSRYAFLVETVEPGSIIGLAAALTGTYDVTARALEDAELGLTSADRVRELLKSDSRLCLSAVTLLDREVARLRTAIANTPIGRSPQDADKPPS